MNRDLFLAILSIDSYNRGYNVGVTGLTVGGAIGSATILTDASTELDPAAAQAAGFYAIAYEWNGETVISYRGTDSPLDAIAFGIGAGQPFALTGGLTDQARLTVEFYRAVAGVDACQMREASKVRLMPWLRAASRGRSNRMRRFEKSIAIRSKTLRCIMPSDSTGLSLRPSASNAGVSA